MCYVPIWAGLTFKSKLAQFLSHLKSIFTVFLICKFHISQIHISIFWLIYKCQPHWLTRSDLIRDLCLKFSNLLRLIKRILKYVRLTLQNAAEKPPPFMPSWAAMYAINTFVVLWILVVGFGFGGWASVTNFVRQVDTFGLFAKCYQCKPPVLPHGHQAPPQIHHWLKKNGPSPRYFVIYVGWLQYALSLIASIDYKWLCVLFFWLIFLYFHKNSSWVCSSVWIVMVACESIGWLH